MPDSGAHDEYQARERADRHGPDGRTDSQPQGKFKDRKNTKAPSLSFAR